MSSSEQYIAEKTAEPSRRNSSLSEEPMVPETKTAAANPADDDDDDDSSRTESEVDEDDRPQLKRARQPQLSVLQQEVTTSKPDSPKRKLRSEKLTPPPSVKKSSSPTKQKSPAKSSPSKSKLVMEKSPKRAKKTNSPVSKKKSTATPAPKAASRDPPGEDNEGSSEPRRSSRARYPPLQYWKGEKLVYGPTDTGVTSMIVPKAIERGDDVVSLTALENEPSPESEMRQSVLASDAIYASKAKKGKPVTENPSYTSDSSPSPPISPVRKSPKTKSLSPSRPRTSSGRAKLKQAQGRSGMAMLWDESTREYTQMRLVGKLSETPDRDLMEPAERTLFERGSERPTGVSPYTASHVEIPVGESTELYVASESAMVYTVVISDIQAVEIRFGELDRDEGVTLSSDRHTVDAGDVFHIPPGNYYQLTNLSRRSKCVLSKVEIHTTSYRKKEDP